MWDPVDSDRPILYHFPASNLLLLDPILGLILARPTFTGYIGPPNALMGSYTPFYKSTTHFYSYLVAFKSSKFEAGKTVTK